MLVVNIFGEPGSGKTSTAAGLFYQLSINGFQAEVVPEAAKLYAWETLQDDTGKTLMHPVFEQQIFLLGKQNRSLQSLQGKREIAIMECPLLMGAVYKPEKYFQHFMPLILEQFNAYNNVNILLERNHTFDPQGRVHSENESNDVRSQLKVLLESNSIAYKSIKTHDNIDKEIAQYIRDSYFPDRVLKSCTMYK